MQKILELINLIKTFFYRWWIPLLTVILMSIIVLIFTNWSLQKGIVLSLAVILFLFVLMATLILIVRLIVKKRWLTIIIALFCFFTINIIIAINIISSSFDPSDGFSDDLEIPENIDLHEVSQWKNDQPLNEYPYQNYILSAMIDTAYKPDIVHANLSATNELFNSHNDIFFHYICSSPAWRVFEKYGGKFATRRWNINNNWQITLHGYYSSYQLPSFSTTNIVPQFENRFSLGLDKKPWISNLPDANKIKIGNKKKLVLKSENDYHKSHCIIELDNCVVEIYDQSSVIERVITQSAIDFTEKEFKALLENPIIDNIKNLIPKTDIRKGEIIFEIHPYFQGGLYNSEIWINPGEPGQIYLKAFEVTKNTQLSADALKSQTNEWIGWSDNPNELFYSNSHFTIYEGDWEKYYAARFEIWFVPDSGEKERKLTEKIFKIEGWQR